MRVTDVPKISPVDAFSDNHSGRFPEITDHTAGNTKTINSAVRVSEHSVSTVPSDRDSLMIMHSYLPPLDYLRTYPLSC